MEVIAVDWLHHPCWCCFSISLGIIVQLTNHSSTYIQHCSPMKEMIMATPSSSILSLLQLFVYLSFFFSLLWVFFFFSFWLLSLVSPFLPRCCAHVWFFRFFKNILISIFSYYFFFFNEGWRTRKGLRKNWNERLLFFNRYKWIYTKKYMYIGLYCLYMVGGYQ